MCECDTWLEFQAGGLWVGSSAFSLCIIPNWRFPGGICCLSLVLCALLLSWHSSCCACPCWDGILLASTHRENQIWLVLLLLLLVFRAHIGLKKARTALNILVAITVHAVIVVLPSGILGSPWQWLIRKLSKTDSGCATNASPGWWRLQLSLQHLLMLNLPRAFFLPSIPAPVLLLDRGVGDNRWG